MSSNTSQFLTNIERKIARNTISVKSNNLKQRSRYSNLNSSLSQSKNLLPSQSHTSAEIRNSNLFSVSASFNDMLNSQQSQSQDWQQYIENQPQNTQIILPADVIMVQQLNLPFGMTLQGVPGTVLIVADGPITTDSVEGQINKLALCEMSIQFQKQTKSLFSVEKGGIVFDIRDCFIGSECNDLQEKSNNSCFEINLQNSIQFDSIVNIISCNISKFSVVVKSGLNSNINIDLCFFSGQKSSCIQCNNPRGIKIRNTVIQNSLANAIDIAYSQNSGISTLQIENNELSNNKHCGILVQGKNDARIAPELNVSNNKISQNQKFGLVVKHIQLQSFNIQGNQFGFNKAAGALLQKVSGCKVKVLDNKFNNQKVGYGIQIYDTSCEVSQNEIFRNELGGIIISGGHRIDDHQDIITIKKCEIYRNSGNGIDIQNYYRGQISLSDLRIFENKNGIFAQNNDLVNADKSQLQITKCEIFLNTQSGILLQQLYCKVFETSIQDNGQTAISLDEGSNETLQIFDKAQVQGDVGGNWGLLYKQKKSACGNKDCQLL